MKYFDLHKEEKQILKDFNDEKLKSVRKIAEEKKRFQAFSQFTLSKTRNINIRLSQKDLLKLKSKAVREGIPYQTLISSVLHRFTARSA